MSPTAVLAFALRESRGARGRLAFFAACLALGVAAIVGVAAVVAAIEDGIRSRSRELLGADVEVSARRELPRELDARVEELGGARRVDTRELATMARAASGRSQLVDLAAVGAGFPLYGGVRLEPALPLDDLGPERVAVAPDLLRDLGAALGDTIRIGKAEYAIAATVLDEPGRLGVSFQSGPRVFATLAGLERAQLIGPGSRVRYRALVQVPAWMDARAVERWAERLKRDLPDAAYLSVETASDAQPSIRRSMERVERYVGLAALLSLILGGVGVAQIVRGWIAARLQAVAVLRAIGYRPRDVLWLLAGHVALLALAASLAGALAGTLLPLALPSLAPEMLPAGFEIAWQPLPIVRGVALGVAIAVVFALPPLTAAWRVAPARVLRTDAEPLPAPRAVSWSAAGAVVLGVLAAVWIQGRSLPLALAFTGGVAVAAGALALGAHGLRRIAGAIPRERIPAWIAHGVSALARPNAGTNGTVVALGLGVLAVCTTLLVESRLAERLRTALPADAPTIFFLDPQPDQWPGIAALLAKHGATGARAVPVTTARLKSIDGQDVTQLAAARRRDEPGRSRWVLTREQRLTWMPELSPDNTIVAGALWSDPERAEASLEEEFAQDLGATLGTRLVFDVQGVPIELTVTSIRSVEWESFSINFFVVVEPGVLDAAPHAMLGAARIEAGAEQAFQDELAGAYGNVTPIRVRPILEKLMELLGKLAVGVRVLGGLTIAVGLVILAGLASAGSVPRAREVALLKALGVRRAAIAGLFATEFVLLGAVAGIAGGAGAAALAWGFLEKVVEVEADVAWLAPIVAAIGAGALAAGFGLIGSARALAARPIESLRG